jgi:hypothetical protein
MLSQQGQKIPPGTRARPLLCRPVEAAQWSWSVQQAGWAECYCWAALAAKESGVGPARGGKKRRTGPTRKNSWAGFGVLGRK